MGKEDIAYEWLEKGIEAREGVAFFTAVIPFMKKYQAQSRFIGLMKKINNPLYIDK